MVMLEGICFHGAPYPMGSLHSYRMGLPFESAFSCLGKVAKHGRCNELIFMGVIMIYKPTYIWGGPILYPPKEMLQLRDSGVRQNILWVLAGSSLTIKSRYTVHSCGLSINQRFQALQCFVNKSLVSTAETQKRISNCRVDSGPTTSSPFSPTHHGAMTVDHSHDWGFPKLGLPQ